MLGEAGKGCLDSRIDAIFVQLCDGINGIFKSFFEIFVGMRRGAPAEYVFSRNPYLSDLIFF